MNKIHLLLFPVLLQSSLTAAPIAGVDFSDDIGANSDAPDDLNPLDSVTVSPAWTFATGQITFDGNSNTDRASAPVGKLDGVVTTGVPPEIGAAPPVAGVHSFSITIGPDPVNLTRVNFDYSAATPGPNVRWIAFRTSLDPNITYSAVAPFRPDFTSALIPLGPQFQNLTNQTVEFYWYAGGEGSGDIDIDSIVIDGIVVGDADADGMADTFEHEIINAVDGDAFATIEDVLPGDDFDSDLSTNLQEYLRATSPVDPDTDNDGLLDGIETNDGTFDDIATDTGTNPLSDDSDNDGLKDNVESNTGVFVDATNTGTSPVEADTDADSIPDGYEVVNGLNPHVNDSSEDPDADGTSNLLEFNNGTDPFNPDTDDDGLKDGVETNTGTFVNAADTGTDPLDPDTDNDGLEDGVETNDGVFDGPGKTGSSPFNSNTDGDNFRDGAEVLLHNTDPSNAASQPTGTANVLFLEADGTGIFGADEVAVRIIEDKYGLANITVMAASAVAAGGETAYDLLVLSSTPGSGDIRGKFIDSTVPIVNWEEAVSDNAAGEFGASSEIMTKSGTTTQMTLADHPIATGLPEVINLFAGANGEITATSMVFGELAIVGTAVNGTGTVGTKVDLDITGDAMVIAIEAGDAVDPISGTLNNTAPARRVMLPFTDNTLNFLSDDALTVFSNSLDWALGILGSDNPLAITNIEVDSTSNPANRIATLTFTSREGRSYTIVSSTDLATLANGGGDEITTVTGTEGSTTVNIDFAANSIPATDAKRFFVVRE